MQLLLPLLHLPPYAFARCTSRSEHRATLAYPHESLLIYHWWKRSCTSMDMDYILFLISFWILFPIEFHVAVCQTGAWFCSNLALANVCLTSQNPTWPPTFERIPVAGQPQNDTEDFGIPNSPPNAAIKDVHRDLHRSNKHGLFVYQKRFVYHETSWPCILGEWTVDVHQFILPRYSRSPQNDEFKTTVQEKTCCSCDCCKQTYPETKIPGTYWTSCNSPHH